MKLLNLQDVGVPSAGDQRSLDESFGTEAASSLQHLAKDCLFFPTEFLARCSPKPDIKATMSPMLCAPSICLRREHCLGIIAHVQLPLPAKASVTSGYRVAARTRSNCALSEKVLPFFHLVSAVQNVIGWILKVWVTEEREETPPPTSLHGYQNVVPILLLSLMGWKELECFYFSSFQERGFPTMIIYSTFFFFFNFT